MTHSHEVSTVLPGLPGAMGMTLHEVSAESAELTLEVRAEHLAATGFLHAGCLVALADTACGYGTLAALPPGGRFTTVSLASSHLATARVGQRLRAVATPLHVGRSTQVWDATVTTEATGAGAGTHAVATVLAVFRCTQLVLDPAPSEQESR
jgi:1,4-dihydroxy-2-naphthoyl-CoA hydrolase